MDRIIMDNIPGKTEAELNEEIEILEEKVKETLKAFRSFSPHKISIWDRIKNFLRKK